MLTPRVLGMTRGQTMAFSSNTATVEWRQHPASLQGRAIVTDVTPDSPELPLGCGHHSTNVREVATRPLFTVVLEQHGDEIFRFACRLTGNRTDADDLYQETLIKAFRAFGRLSHDANHRAWLYRICSNTWISDRRKHGRVFAMNDVLADTLAMPVPDHAGALDARDLLDEVEYFVDKLPPKQRVALVLRKYHELDYAEIAEVLKCSEAAARANVHEALTKLRRTFADRIEV